MMGVHGIDSFGVWVQANLQARKTRFVHMPLIFDVDEGDFE